MDDDGGVTFKDGDTLYFARARNIVMFEEGCIHLSRQRAPTNK